MSPKYMYAQSQNEDKLEQFRTMYDKIESVSDTLLQCAGWFAEQDKDDAYSLAPEQIKIIRSASAIVKNVIAQKRTALNSEIDHLCIPEIDGPPSFANQSVAVPTQKEKGLELPVIYGPPDFLEVDNWGDFQ